MISIEMLILYDCTFGAHHHYETLNLQKTKEMHQWMMDEPMPVWADNLWKNQHIKWIPSVSSENGAMTISPAIFSSLTTHKNPGNTSSESACFQSKWGMLSK